MYGSIVLDPESQEQHTWKRGHGVLHNLSMISRVMSDYQEDDESSVSWELVLLLSAEFLSFAVVLLPLIPQDDTAKSMGAFWDQYRLVSLAACLPYVALTVPVAIGYYWFLSGVKINILVWMTIVLSLAFVCHIASVTTDPRGVFVGTMSLAVYLLILTGCIGFRVNFVRLNSVWVFVFALLWPIIVFLPIYLVQGLSLESTIGSCIATGTASVFLTCELRLMENGMQVSELETSDPFTRAIWVNCATWRFLVQVCILGQKVAFHIFARCLHALAMGWRWIITLCARRTPSHWLTPQTIKRII